MKRITLLILIFSLAGCGVLNKTTKTKKYYQSLIGNTYHQISNPNILARGDTMIFRFVDSTLIVTGFSHLLTTTGRLHNNSKYDINCKTNPCSITLTYFKYDSLGNEIYDSTYIPKRGRIEILTDSTFRVRFITNHMDKRPVTFKPDDHPDIVIFKIKN